MRVPLMLAALGWLSGGQTAVCYLSVQGRKSKVHPEQRLLSVITHRWARWTFPPPSRWQTPRRGPLLQNLLSEQTRYRGIFNPQEAVATPYVLITAA